MKENKEIIDRFKKVVEYSGLEVRGLAILIDKSVGHINSIIGFRKNLSKNIVSEIGAKMDFDGSIILDPSIPIPKEKIENSPTLNEFKAANISKASYFVDTKIDRSINQFIEDYLLKSKIFEGEPKYTNEIRLFCKNQFGKKYSSGDLSRGLNYVVEKHELNFKLAKPLKIKKILKSKKQPIKKKDNTLGERMVDVFYLVENKKEGREVAAENNIKK